MAKLSALDGAKSTKTKKDNLIMKKSFVFIAVTIIIGIVSCKKEKTYNQLIISPLLVL